LNKGAAGKSPTADYSNAPSSGLGVFESSFTTKEAVVSNLKNLILTQKGERFMQPTFGTNIRKVLFENNTSEIRAILNDTIEDDIKYWLPYVSLKKTTVEPSADRHSLNIKLEFRITSIGANVVINVLASENEFTVTDIAEDVLTEVGSFNTDTAFGLGAGGTY
jgi:phage baseplate assembly protein W